MEVKNCNFISIKSLIQASQPTFHIIQISTLFFIHSHKLLLEILKKNITHIYSFDVNWR